MGFRRIGDQATGQGHAARTAGDDRHPVVPAAANPADVLIRPEPSVGERLGLHLLVQA